MKRKIFFCSIAFLALATFSWPLLYSNQYIIEVRVEDHQAIERIVRGEMERNFNRWDSYDAPEHAGAGRARYHFRKFGGCSLKLCIEAENPFEKNIYRIFIDSSVLPSSSSSASAAEQRLISKLQFEGIQILSVRKKF